MSNVVSLPSGLLSTQQKLQNVLQTCLSHWSLLGPHRYNVLVIHRLLKMHCLFIWCVRHWTCSLSTPLWILLRFFKIGLFLLNTASTMVLIISRLAVEDMFVLMMKGVFVQQCFWQVLYGFFSWALQLSEARGLPDELRGLWWDGVVNKTQLLSL